LKRVSCNDQVDKTSGESCLKAGSYPYPLQLQDDDDCYWYIDEQWSKHLNWEKEKNNLMKKWEEQDQVSYIKGTNFIPLILSLYDCSNVISYVQSYVLNHHHSLKDVKRIKLSHFKKEIEITLNKIKVKDRIDVKLLILKPKVIFNLFFI